MTTPPALLAFFRQEAGEYLDQLDQLVAPDDAPDGAALLSHTRALRGAATMTKLGGLPELASTLERVASGYRDGELRWEQRLQFALRGALVEVRALVGKVESWTDVEQRQARTHSVALASVAAGYLSSPTQGSSPASPVIPIARLFPDDGLPGLVERNHEPPVTLAERFRNDMAAAADGVARESANLVAGERGAQELTLTDAVRRTLLGLGDVAESYGAATIANLALRMARSALEKSADRMAVQAFAQLLMDRELSDAELAARVREHATTWPGAEMPRGDTPLSQPPVRETPVRAAPVQHTPVRPTMTAPPQDTSLVPIESLLYSGESALARARAVRDELRIAWQRAGGTAMDPKTSALLDELSDLLDLAVAH